MQPANFAMKRPYAFTALMVVAIIAVYLAAGTVAAISKLPTMGLYLIADLVLAALGAVLLTRMHLWKAVGFRALGAPQDLRLYWLPFFVVLVNLVFGIARMSVGQVAFSFVLAGLVGFVEEIFFRGLILRAIAPRGLWKAAIISSILFGLVHSLNVLAGANSLYTLLQVGYAMAIGFGFAAVTLRTGAIWPLVIIHALIDFTSFLASNGMGASSVTTIDVVVSAIWIVAFTAYGVFIMRIDAANRILFSFVVWERTSRATMRDRALLAMAQESSAIAVRAYEGGNDMKHKRSSTALIAVDGFTGVTALIGMAMLLTNWPFRLPLSSLRYTPFGDYTVPALILGIVVGGSALLAMGATISRASVGPVLALVAGAIMIGWIVGEMVLLPTNLFTDFATDWLQGVYLLVGGAMIVLALQVAPGGWRGILSHPHVGTRKGLSPSSTASPPLA